MAIKVCVLRNDIADRLVCSGYHYGQNQSDGADEATRYLLVLS